MKVRAALLLSLRNFYAGKKNSKHVYRLSNAVLGIAVSLIPLIIVIVVSGGMIEGITSRYLEVASYHIRLSSFRDVSEEELNSTIHFLENVHDVTAVVPIRQGLGLLNTPENRLGVSVRGLGETVYERDAGFNKHIEIVSGDFNLSDSNSMVVSQTVAESIDVRIGDTVKLVTAKRFPGRPLVLKTVNFEVKGIFSTGYQELDATLVYVPFTTASSLFSEGGSLYLGVKVDHPFQDLSFTIDELQEALEGKWFIYPWYEVERSMFASLSTTRNLLIFIMAVIVCVAAVNISSSLYMLVLEKHEEIAILKGFGTGPQLISISFLLTGFFTGLAGVLFGVIFGLAIAVNINNVIRFIEWIMERVIQPITAVLSRGTPMPTEFKVLNPAYYLDSIPIRIRLIDICFVVVMVMILSLVASYFPSRKAAMLKPLEVLRKHG